MGPPENCSFSKFQPITAELCNLDSSATCDWLKNKQSSNGPILDLDFSIDFCFKIVCINFHCYNKRRAKILCSL